MRYIVILLMFFAVHTVASTYSVSIVQLIAVPERFLEKDVSVYGYFTTGIGGMLFLSEKHAVDGDIASSISVLDPSNDGEMTMQCRKKYVYITGHFTRFKNQTSLTDVKRVVGKDGKPCWSR